MKVLVAVTRVPEVHWAALPYREWFPKDYAQLAIELKSEECLTVGWNSKGAKSKEGSQSVFSPIYRVE